LEGGARAINVDDEICSDTDDLDQTRRLDSRREEIRSMILAVLVGLSQLADGLAYQLAQGHGRELNPGAATVITTLGPMAMLAIKTGAALILGLGSYALLQHGRGRRVIPWLAVVGFFGAFTELRALI
jgi:hypothetical protein